MLKDNNTSSTSDGSVTKKDAIEKYNKSHPVVIDLTRNGKRWEGRTTVPIRFTIERVASKNLDRVEVTFFNDSDSRSFLVLYLLESQALMLDTDSTTILMKPT
jgi:hypothetical protein